MRCIFEIATDCRRVRGISPAAGAGGDAARSVGYVWSKAGTETLYLRSKAVLDARAAGIQYPIVASWFDIKDLAHLLPLASEDVIVTGFRIERRDPLIRRLNARLFGGWLVRIMLGLAVWIAVDPGSVPWLVEPNGMDMSGMNM